MRSLRVTDFGADLVWEESATPDPRDREVVLEVVACGVCHSDLHLWEGYYDFGRERRSYVKDGGVTLPITLGHEVVGRVTAVGPSAEGVEVGDVRLVYPWIGCGACAVCAAGDEHLCASPRSLGVYRPGGYGESIVVPGAEYLLGIGDLAPETACSFACAGLTAYSALRKILPLTADDTLLLVGAGGVGLMALQLVHELTPARVIVADVSDAKLDVARSILDCATLNTHATSAPHREIRRLTMGRGAAAVLDFVGSGDSAALGVSSLARNGMLVVVGLFGGELNIPLPLLPLKNVTVRGSYTGSPTELRELMALARSGQLRMLPVSRYPLADAQRVLECLRAGEVVGRAVLVPA